jgi:hypothetical protein
LGINALTSSGPPDGRPLESSRELHFRGDRCYTTRRDTIFLCAEEGGRRPVVFANSEGEGGLLADDLAGALEIIIGLAWQDCLSFSGGGDVKATQTSAQRIAKSTSCDRAATVQRRHLPGR